MLPWDRCDIWYATSTDGWTWKEEGLAVPRGEKGAYDDRSVFTVEIMKHDGKYYLCYQTVKSPYNVRVKNQVGLAWADSPDGPWTKSKEPILSPADNGIWKGEEQNRFLVEKKGDFDSHKVHDPCILPFKGKFYLYYKGEQMGEEINFGGRMIRHGVAIADNPRGPYIKSPYNPISNSGHEVCVWPYNGGIASLITTDGPERNTIQWSPDGINFEIMSHIQGAPHAIGLNRSADNEKEPTEILRWGLTHQYRTGDYQYIRRFSSRRLFAPHRQRRAGEKVTFSPRLCGRLRVAFTSVAGGRASASPRNSHWLAAGGSLTLDRQPPTHGGSSTKSHKVSKVKTDRGTSDSSRRAQFQYDHGFRRQDRHQVACFDRCVRKRDGLDGVGLIKRIVRVDLRCRE